MMPLGRDRITAFYLNRQKLITKTVKEHFDRYGGEWDELVAEANFLFAKHVHTWNSRRGSLNTHIVFRVRTGLMDLRRRKGKAYRRRMESITDVTEPSYHPPTPSFLTDFVDELEQDAQTIVACLLMPDIDLQIYLATRDGLRAVQRALREYFDHKDWEPERVSAAFSNVKSTLAKPYHTRTKPFRLPRPRRKETV